MRRGGWRRRVGATSAVVGVLLLLFVAYQLWGSAVYTWHAQDRLKAELARTLHHPLPTTAQVAQAAEHRGRLPAGIPALATTPADPTAQPAAGAPIGLLSIPRIGLEDAIVQGTAGSELEQGPGHYATTALPGEWGNAAIAGHRTTYAHPFYDLSRVRRGDPIYVLTVQGLFRYVVTGQHVVAPTDLAVLDGSSETATLTLTTCNPRYSAAQRLVVTAVFSPGGTPTPGRAIAAHARRLVGVAPSSSLPAGRRTLAGARAPAGGGLGGSGNGVLPAIGWGLITAEVAIGVLVVHRLLPHRSRWLLGGAGTLGLLVALFVFYEHLSLALPASF